MIFVLQCDTCPNEKLDIFSETALESMRSCGREYEAKILFCKACQKKVTITKKVQAAIQHGYDRLKKKNQQTRRLTV